MTVPFFVVGSLVLSIRRSHLVRKKMGGGGRRERHAARKNRLCSSFVDKEGNNTSSSRSNRKILQLCQQDDDNDDDALLLKRRATFSGSPPALSQTWEKVRTKGRCEEHFIPIPCCRFLSHQRRDDGGVDRVVAAP